MAKQLVNPIERHVEKAVLGLTGLGLVAAIGLYLASSPNQLELGGRIVKPTTIDQLVARKASAVREVVRQAKSNVELPKRLSKAFVRGLRPFAVAKLSDAWPGVAPMAPEVPILDAPGVVTGQRDLAKVIPLERPTLAVGRSTFEVDGLKAANWVTVSGLFDVKKQTRSLAKEYGAANKRVIFGPMQMERRTRREDGTWSDDDWAAVEAFGQDTFPKPPTIRLIPSGDGFSVPREDSGAADSYIRRLTEPQTQLDTIRLLLPPILNGDPWSPPVITSVHDIVVEDDFFLNPGKPPSADPINRYISGDEGQTTEAVEETPDDVLKQAETLRKSAYEHKSLDEITQAFNLALPIEQDKKLGLAIRQRAKTLRIKIEQTESDIRRYELQIGSGGNASETEDNVEFVRTPPPQQQLWVHDANPGSVVSGKTYQYRVRPSIINVLVGDPDKFRDPQDATKFFIPGPWTKPLEVAIKPDMYYFLASDDQRKHEVSVELYRWYEGVWVKSRFKFGVEDRIVGQSRCQVPPLEGGSGFETPLVDFAADATVVDIDFMRSYRERKRGTTRSGVQFAPASVATSVVLVDADGRLQERFVPTDRSSPEKRKIMVWKPRKKQP